MFFLFRRMQPHQFPNDPNGWSDNERKIFIWFMVCVAEQFRLSNQLILKHHWVRMAETFFGKRPEFLEFQYLNMMKPMRRIAWEANEDELLVNAVRAERSGKWN